MKKVIVTKVSHAVCIYSQIYIQWYCFSNLKLAMMQVFTLYTWRNTINQVFFSFSQELSVKHSQHYWLQVVTWGYIFPFDRQISPLYVSVSLSKFSPPRPPHTHTYPLGQFCLSRLRLDYSLLWASLQFSPHDSSHHYLLPSLLHPCNLLPCIHPCSPCFLQFQSSYSSWSDLQKL